MTSSICDAAVKPTLKCTLCQDTRCYSPQLSILPNYIVAIFSVQLLSMKYLVAS